MRKELTGIPASDGISISKAFLFQTKETNIEKKIIDSTEKELKKLEVSIEKSKNELLILQQETEKNLGKEKSDIFSAHLMIIDDPEFIGKVKEMIENESVNAEYSLLSVRNDFIQIFEALDNDYMKERASDIKDISERLLNHLTNNKKITLDDIKEEVIIITEDLTPSNTAQLNRKYIKGFVTDIGGKTSHTAIMARSLGIPAIVGVSKSTIEIKNNDVVIVDALEGKILINPTEKEIELYKAKKEDYEKKEQMRQSFKNKKTYTNEGIQVELAANIGSSNDIEQVLHNGAEGIGLFRTEFLYMDRESPPTEDEQFSAYKTVLKGMKGKPVVIRTLDVGGDKEIPYLNLPKEFNPFLGFRAIRYCLENKNIFKVQLRALLRASIYGNLKIMFPMIATIDEFREAKDFLNEVKKELQGEDIKIAEGIEIGIMVEVPSTAILANQFAKEVDFFSIGTNDLIQYTFASDRMNEKVSYLYQPFNPALLNLVKLVIDAAHNHGKWVGMCGEMAGDKRAIPILLALGLDEFSMSASHILPAREQISTLSKKELEQRLSEILNCSSSKEVLELLKKT